MKACLTDFELRPALLQAITRPRRAGTLISKRTRSKRGPIDFVGRAVGVLAGSHERHIWAKEQVLELPKSASDVCPGICRRLLTKRPGRCRGGPGQAFSRQVGDQCWRSASLQSPAAHMAPFSNYSFFQMGTSDFRRSMASIAAENAGFRWGAATTTTTLASPTGTCPSRWTIANRLIS